jgi:hypothetical protein
LDAADVRDLIVTVRMNQAEYRQLQARAMRAGKSIGEFMRALVAGGQLEGERPGWGESLAEVVNPVERGIVEPVECAIGESGERSVWAEPGSGRLWARQDPAAAGRRSGAKRS